jgi:carbamoyl-phosphate synthase large subunit
LDDLALDGLGQGDDKNVFRAALGQPTPDRILKVAQAMRLGVEHEQIHASCKIDPWFLERIQEIVDLEARVKAHGLPVAAEPLHQLKAAGFSDARLAKLAGLTEADVRRTAHRSRCPAGIQGHRHLRRRVRLPTAYVLDPTSADWSCRRRASQMVVRSTRADPSDRDKVVILGGGPNRIGQGIEFDYCCCHACFALSKAGTETIMIAAIETVSTDYDTSDRLYFGPLTAEDVLEIIAVEQSRGGWKGVIVQFGGQTRLKLAHALEAAACRFSAPRPTPSTLPRIGTGSRRWSTASGSSSPRAGLRATSRGSAASLTSSATRDDPPSYVLGGRAMEIVADGPRSIVTSPGSQPRSISPPSWSCRRSAAPDRPLPLTPSRSMSIACATRTPSIAGIMEHIEEAGIHSGDSACSLPPTRSPPRSSSASRSRRATSPWRST